MVIFSFNIFFIVDAIQKHEKAYEQAGPTAWPIWRWRLPGPPGDTVSNWNCSRRTATRPLHGGGYHRGMAASSQVREEVLEAGPTQ